MITPGGESPQRLRLVGSDVSEVRFGELPKTDEEWLARLQRVAEVNWRLGYEQGRRDREERTP